MKAVTVPNSPAAGEVSVSVIIPVYNVAPYLRQCLDSVLGQTLDAIEVICVDDGSDDGSAEILQQYACSDRRISIITQTNHGYGYAMNRGLEAATGTYIGIVESDDWVEQTMFEDLVRAARRSSADIAKSNFYRTWAKPESTDSWLLRDPIWERWRHRRRSTGVQPALTSSATPSHPPGVARYASNRWIQAKRREDIFTYFGDDENGLVIRPRDYRGGTFLRRKSAVWSAIYRRDFIQHHGLRFLQTPGAAFQDTSFNFKALALAERMVCLARAYVHYRQDNDTSSTNSGGMAYCVCDEFTEIEKFIAAADDLAPVAARIFAPMVYDTFIWNYDRLDENLKLPFLKVASQWFHRLISENRVDWDSFNQRKRTNFRIIAYDPATYHHWRERQAMTKRTRHQPVAHVVKRALNAVVPPSRTVFARQVETLARQLEAQERMMENLERQIGQLTQIVRGNSASDSE